MHRRIVGRAILVGLACLVLFPLLASAKLDRGRGRMNRAACCGVSVEAPVRC